MFLERELLGDATTYTGKEARKLLDRLISSQKGDGHIPYHELRQIFNQVQIEEMIARNVVYFRPPSDFFRDLSPMPREAVVTPANGVPALRAMEE